MNSEFLLTVFLLLATLQNASANGGGYFRGGVSHSGDIAGFEPEATQHIRIVDEKLDIRLGKEQAKVEVRYLMKNMTDQKIKTRFGFPVEELSSRDLMDGPEQKIPDAKKLSYCRNYQINTGGKPVKSIWHGELNQEKDTRLKGISGWLISELVFSPDEEKTVMIRFEVDYPLEHWYVSDDASTTASIFRYRLSSAACWHGTIGTGRIVIEPESIDPDDIRVIKPVNRFKKDGNRWIWHFENLEPTLADDLEIEASPASRIYGGQTIGKWKEGFPFHLYADYIERGKQWSMLHSNYTVKASSTLKPEGDFRYDPENIRARWEENAWSEGAPGPGIGAWLEITPVEAKPLLEIHMQPGYQKDNLFKANARPKSVRIELNGEHRFDAEIPNREEWAVIPVRGYDKPVRKIHITFTEVYPGSRFEDLCVSGVLLHASLDRKPSIQPAR